MEIYLVRNGQRFGPYTEEWLETFLADGTVRGDDLAWASGRADWVPVQVFLAELRTQRAVTPHDEIAPAAAPSASAVENQSSAVASDGIAPLPGREESVAEEVWSDPVTAATDAPLDSAAGGELIPRTRPAISLKAILVVAAAVPIIVATVLFALVPDHVSVARTESGFLRPDPGYVFVDPGNAFDWSVRWAPGTPSLTERNVIAGEQSDTWRPAPGYERPDGDEWREVVWVPGKREVEYPHVTAGTSPDTWIADPAYDFTSTSPRTPTVAWQSGVRLPHMTSADRENYWILDPGYSFVDRSDTHPQAAWSPGERHPSYAHVFASSTEGRWSVDAGFTWVTSDVGDFTTFSPARTWAVWRAAYHIDAATLDLSCTDPTLTAAIELARDRYAALDLTDVHPALGEHIRSVRTSLSDGANVMNTCLLATNAGDVADTGAALWCGVTSLFGDDNWGDCMDRSATVREVISAGSGLASIPCDQALSNFGRTLDTIPVERRTLQSSFGQYGLQLDAPFRMVSCRR